MFHSNNSMKDGDQNSILSKAKSLLHRYFIQALGSMALGLFASLIIGSILSQLSNIPYLEFLKEYSQIIGPRSPVVGAAIGVAIAYGLKLSPLVIFSSAATGAFGYSLLGPTGAMVGPVGAFVSGVVGAEFGNLISGKTKIDIVLVPITTIVTGSFAGKLVGPSISHFMGSLGDLISTLTVIHPIPMGILIAVLMGMFLTAPISSAAIAITLGMSGIAAGASTVGCCAQMVGFAVMSYKVNGMGGLLSQGLGTSMLQVPNIVRHPLIWLPPILTSAILGPISTTILEMKNTPLGAGMGTSGLVGQFGTFAAMSDTMSSFNIIVMIILFQLIIPALLTLLFYNLMKIMDLIKDDYLKLNL